MIGLFALLGALFSGFFGHFLSCLLRRSLLGGGFLRCLLGRRLLCCFFYGQRFTSLRGFGALFGRSLLGCGLSALRASAALFRGGLLCGRWSRSFFRGCLLRRSLLCRSLLGRLRFRRLGNDNGSLFRYALIVVGRGQYAGGLYFFILVVQ